MIAIEQSVHSKAQPGRRTSVVRHASDERHKHLSAVLEQIRDDGPALQTGTGVLVAERLHKNTAPVQPAAANDAKVPVPAGQTVPTPHRTLPIACLALAITLACSIGYSVWLQTRIAGIESLLLDSANEPQQTLSPAGSVL